MAEKFKINRLYVMTEASFATEPSATGSGYAHIKAHDIAFQPTVEVIERPGETGDMTRNPHVMGAKGGTLTFKLELKGSGSPASAAATAPEANAILVAALGTRVIGTGTTVSAAPAPTATGFTVASAAGLAVGMAIEVAGQVRFIKTISTNAITLHKALSGAPASSTVVYASNMYRRAASGHTTCAFVIIKDNVQHTLLGGKVAVAIEGITAKGTALLAVSVECADYSRSTKASLPAADLTGITAVRAPVVKGSPLDIAGAVRSAVGLSFDPGVTINFLETMEGAENKGGIDIVDSQPKGSFQAYYNVGHMDDFEAGNLKEIAFACGDRTNGFGIFVPLAQFLQPTFAERNGTLGEDVPFAVCDNGTAPEYMISLF